MKRPVIHDINILSKPSVPATLFDTPVADDLMDTLISLRSRCVGMAANMIGVNKRIIVFLSADVPMEMFNPVILHKSQPYDTEESCLSLEGSRPVKRFRRIRVAWQSRDFKRHEADFSGFTAQIIQHELDHLEGILI